MHEPKLCQTQSSAATVSWTQVQAMTNGADANTSHAALRWTAPADHPPDVAMDDWETLFSAVTARLRCSVSESARQALVFNQAEAIDQVQAMVLECAAAFDQLQQAALHELRRYAQLEQELAQTKAELALVRNQLLDSQAPKRQFSHLAMHDRLTALPNRSLFRERLNHLLNSEQPPCEALTVLYLDLDGFKPINDAYGHDAGGELLQIIASRLTRAVGAPHMVSRMGGDEFACLLGELQSREQLGVLAEKLFDVVSAPLHIGKLKHTVRPAIGIASSPTDGVTCDALLKNAHAAMHRAKRRQVGFTFFDQVDE